MISEWNSVCAVSIDPGIFYIDTCMHAVFLKLNYIAMQGTGLLVHLSSITTG